jgi:hypothetical protein
MTRLLIALTFLAAATAAAPARADTSATCTAMITTLPVVLTTRGVYCMDKDLATGIATGAAITVHTNQVTIDCNGYRISGLGAGTATQAQGVFAGGRSLTTVRNCGIRGFSTGIVMVGSTNLIEDNHLDQNRVIGIEVSGNRNLVRGNRVFDTGGSDLAATQVMGIYAEWDTDVRDNTVEGVRAAAAPDTDIYGIRQYAGNGVHVAGNMVRKLLPSGTGAAFGIYTSHGQDVFVDRNRVSLTDVVATSTGYRCNGSNGAFRENSEWGFTTFNTGCLDDGGNVDL